LALVFLPTVLLCSYEPRFLLIQALTSGCSLALLFFSLTLSFGLYKPRFLQTQAISHLGFTLLLLANGPFE
jgi:hypothetical protein